jgi:glycosyltransferase involved in cell wall biosynthesis
MGYFADKRLSIVIPAYNEEQVIGRVLDEIISLNVADEIIVVNDGSQDGTSAVVRARAQVRLVEHPYNIGNGAAVKTGVRAATGDVILLMDGDGQHPPAEIPNLLQHMGAYDMVVGARSSASEAQAHRTLANRIFNSYASYVVGRPVLDLTSGFRAIRAPLIRNFLYLLPNTFSYPTTITIALFRAGFAVKYQPFVSPARVGKSKIRPLKDGMRFLLTITRLAVLFVPLKIFLPVSLTALGFGLFYTSFVLLTQQRFSGAGGLAITVGVLTFLLGLVSEQIALLRYINSDR